MVRYAVLRFWLISPENADSGLNIHGTSILFWMMPYVSEWNLARGILPEAARTSLSPRYFAGVDLVSNNAHLSVLSAYSLLAADQYSLCSPIRLSSARAPKKVRPMRTTTPTMPVIITASLRCR